MSNPIPGIIQSEIENHLKRLDKAFSILVNDETIKSKLDKEDFYAGLKFGNDNAADYGIITHLYKRNKELEKDNGMLEARIHGLEEDAKSFAVAINNMHKYLETLSSNQAYYNQSRWYEIGNTLSKYGEY